MSRLISASLITVAVILIAVLVAMCWCLMVYQPITVKPTIKMPEAIAKTGNQQVTISTLIYKTDDAKLEADKSVPVDILRGVNQGGAVSAAPNATATQSGAVTAPSTTKSATGKK